MNIHELMKSLKVIELHGAELAKIEGGRQQYPVTGYTDCAIGADDVKRCCSFDALGHVKYCWTE